MLYAVKGVAGFAEAYGAGTYNDATYGCPASAVNCASTSANGGSSLADTGVLVGGVVGVACLLLLLVVLVRFWRRPAARPDDRRHAADDQSSATPRSQQQ